MTVPPSYPVPNGHPVWINRIFEVNNFGKCVHILRRGIFFVMNGDDPFTLPDLDYVVPWCTERNSQGIHCTISALAEYAQTTEQSKTSIVLNLLCIRTIAHYSLDASLSIKPSAIGILYDREEYFRNLTLLYLEGRKREVAIEIDMEGRDFVSDVLQSVRVIAKQGNPITLALQAYLDRTPHDLDTCTRAGIRVRLVKGAYAGDISDFLAIEGRFETHIDRLIASGRNFCVGTHDPALIAWIQTRAGERKRNIELGFLKGLGDRTKVRLAGMGWNVSEYVPFGEGGAPYRARREHYLLMLEKGGRSPVP